MTCVLYLHVSWTTYERAPMITAKVRSFLRPFLRDEARRHGACIIALEMGSDHVHAVVEAPPRWDLPRLIQGLKGGSAYQVNKRRGITREPIRWANGYDARTIGPGELQRAIRYVQNQSSRHPDRAISE